MCVLEAALDVWVAASCGGVSQAKALVELVKIQFERIVAPEVHESLVLLAVPNKNVVCNNLVGYRKARIVWQLRGVIKLHRVNRVT
jgi:hypothetical protein